MIRKKHKWSMLLLILQLQSGMLNLHEGNRHVMTCTDVNGQHLTSMKKLFKTSTLKVSTKYIFGAKN